MPEAPNLFLQRKNTDEGKGSFDCSFFKKLSLLLFFRLKISKWFASSCLRWFYKLLLLNTTSLNGCKKWNSTIWSAKATYPLHHLREVSITRFFRLIQQNLIKKIRSFRQSLISHIIIAKIVVSFHLVRRIRFPKPPKIRQKYSVIQGIKKKEVKLQRWSKNQRPISGNSECHVRVSYCIINFLQITLSVYLSIYHFMAHFFFVYALLQRKQIYFLKFFISSSGWCILCVSFNHTYGHNGDTLHPKIQKTYHH